MGPWNPWLHEPKFGKLVWVALVGARSRGF
jgi:hypothetical protein